MITNKFKKISTSQKSNSIIYFIYLFIFIHYIHSHVRL